MKPANMNTPNQWREALRKTRPMAIRLYLRSLRLSVLVGNVTVITIFVIQSITDRVAHPSSTVRELLAQTALTPATPRQWKESA